jgi:integrase
MGVFKYREKWTIFIRAKDPVKKQKVQIRKVATRQTKRGAQEEERHIRNALADGSYWRDKYEAPEQLTYANFVEQFLADYCEVKLAESTVRDYEKSLRNHVIPVIGHKLLEDIGPRDVAKLEGRLSDYAPKSVRNILGYLKRSLNVAAEWGYLEDVPTIKLPKVGKTAPKFLTSEEAQRYQLAADKESENMGWLVKLGLNSGMRIGEMIALKYEDLDYDRRIIHVRRSMGMTKIKSTKSGHERQIPMTATLAATRLEGEGFIVQKDGEPYTYQMLRKPLNRVQAAAKIPDDKRGWHTLRHTFASHLAMKGVPIQSISHLLGHSNIQVTMRYAHLSPSVMQSHVERLDGLFSKPSLKLVSVESDGAP